MNAATVERLSALNREFYAQFAEIFSRARPVKRTNLDAIMPYLAGCVKLLDVGCGNGRLAGRLDEQGKRLKYLGVDVTPGLVAIAQGSAATLTHVEARFRIADITRPGWEHAVADLAPFDAITALAVLHHIPSKLLRTAVLRSLHTLLRPAGVVILSNWQFVRSSRLMRKQVPWAAVGIDEREVETGDALLDWQRGGSGHRYCHLLTTDEMVSLAAQSGFAVSAQFPGDGGLNLFSILSAL